MRYKTPAALEMAVKAAAKESPMDTGRAISRFYFHRLLCRVFSSPGGRFVLKGGQGMLARTVDARAPRDIDLLSKERTLDAALDALKLAASKDLDDHMHFVFESARKIKTEDEYRSGLNVVFTPWLGPKRMQAISIDLVIDEVPLDEAEPVTPADRIPIDGIEVCDYLVYPVENALADKACAIAERYNDRPSSRVKDLVDILVYATNCIVDGEKRMTRIQREVGARGISLPKRFTIPEGWEGRYEKQFTKLLGQTGAAESYRSIAEATAVAGKLFNPIFSGEATGLKWDSKTLSWTHIAPNAE